MKKAVITLLMAFSFAAVYAQDYNIVPEESKVLITGTSNVHDWEAPAEEFSGNASIEIVDDTLVSITNLKFNVKVEEINSGKGGMDKRIDGALNMKKHPNITFELTDIEEILDSSLVANGKLTIAGVTNTIQMEVDYEILPDGKISFIGTQPINMRDYKVDPPTAMFGAIKAGELVEVTFDAKFVASLNN